jgi:glycosyltransferase involved in cell wall biosynthesis
VENLAKGLSRINLNVTVISGYPTSIFKSKPRSSKYLEENVDGIRILRFPYLSVPPRHAMFQLSNLKQLIKVIKKINPDVIHGQSGSAFPISAFLGDAFPFVVTFHTSPMVQRILSIYSLLRGGSKCDFLTYVVGYPAWSLTFKKELDQSRLAVAVSENLKQDLLSEMGKDFEEKICVVHNGIDVETLDRDHQREATIEESNNIILFAGRLFWGKGALVLTKLAYLFQKENLDFRIIVHGEGPLFKQLKFRLNALKLTNIELKGFANRTQLLRSMKLSRFILIPSFYEACPMILLEGMCLGKVPVMFDLPYAREFTNNGKYGILAKNVKDMMSKIVIYNKNENINNSKREIQKYAKRKFDINTVVQEYYRLYQKVHDF